MKLSEQNADAVRCGMNALEVAASRMAGAEDRKMAYDAVDTLRALLRSSDDVVPTSLRCVSAISEISSQICVFEAEIRALTETVTLTPEENDVRSAMAHTERSIGSPPPGKWYMHCHEFVTVLSLLNRLKSE